MGMLDEAIRDHFDLKRRNGADPAVVAIEEREALGDPAQREARAAEALEEVAGETHIEAVIVSEEADGVAFVEEVDEAPASAPVDEGVVEESVVVSEEVGAVEVAFDRPASGDVSGEAQFEAETPEQETRQFTVEESQEAVMPGPPSRPVGAPPAAPQDPAAAQEADVSPGEEAQDELEQTPEFLEETPEHDRLWFERKPPRDFDF